MKALFGILGGGVVLAAVVAVLGSGVCCYVADGSSSDWTLESMFRQTLSVTPSGKKLYWLGPSSNHMRLYEASLNFEGDPEKHGVEFIYRGYDVVYLYVYMSPHRPAPMYDKAHGMRVLGRLVTPTNQLVLFTCAPDGACAPPDVVERLKRSVRPVASADIDALPDSWADISIF